ncbi:MAG: YidC/Oxa1 family membrane protein insertase [Lachnospiraceae bacterium]|nr:YidC/Oxa1 family membrane protein insertase [Lachnospiraceae bacterium]
MGYILLTKNGNFIIRPFAEILGWIMEGIFWVLEKLSIPNIGFTIILFTIIVYLLMLPLTIKQQKFSKMSAKMNPELQAIQNKYKGKSDQASLEKMQQETQLVYAKYGVNPSGSCLQLLIQMPILFALYRVIYSMPAYVGKIRAAFAPLVGSVEGVVDGLTAQEGSIEFIKTFSSYRYYQKQFTNEAFTNFTNGLASPENIEYVKNSFVDVLNRASTSEWLKISEQYPNLAHLVTNANGTGTYDLLSKYNDFFGLNIGNSPSYTITTSWQTLQDKVNICENPGLMWGLIIGAIMIPVLAALTQWINVKLMPQQESNNKAAEENTMVASMKMMNNIMPLFSAFLCFTLPIGMGIYWISGSVVRSIIQVVVNKRMDKIDIDEMIKQNIEKNNEKRRKMGLPAQTITANATMSTKNVEHKDSSSKSSTKKEHDVKAATNYYNSNESKPGSLASKAAMVKKYNEKNSK